MESPFYRGIKKIKKSYYNDKSIDFEKDIKELLYKNVPIAESILEDLYYKYCSGSENVFDSAKSLSDVVELFNCDYDEVNDPLKEEDWIYVRNIVNASADELDMDTVTYIMRLIVEKGYI